MFKHFTIFATLFIGSVAIAGPSHTISYVTTLFQSDVFSHIDPETGEYMEKAMATMTATEFLNSNKTGKIGNVSGININPYIIYVEFSDDQAHL